MEKFYFGMETLRVTQDYNTGSHYNHSHGIDYKDYPIDVAGIDGRQSAYFAPVDMKVVAIRGIGNYATNTIWLESINKVETPTFTDYVWLTLTHWNDSSKTAKYQVGDIIKSGDIIGYEGTDGASANHLHLTCGRGHCNNWVKNNLGSWVMLGESLKPEEVMYINDKFTKVVNDAHLKFVEINSKKYKSVNTKKGLVLMKLDNSGRICVMPYKAQVEILDDNYTIAKGYNMSKVKYDNIIGMCANKYLR